MGTSELRSDQVDFSVHGVEGDRHADQHDLIVTSPRRRVAFATTAVAICDLGTAARMVVVGFGAPREARATAGRRHCLRTSPAATGSGDEPPPLVPVPSARNHGDQEVDDGENGRRSHVASRSFPCMRVAATSSKNSSKSLAPTGSEADDQPADAYEVGADSESALRRVKESRKVSRCWHRRRCRTRAGMTAPTGRARRGRRRPNVDPGWSDSAAAISAGSKSTLTTP